MSGRTNHTPSTPKTGTPDTRASIGKIILWTLLFQLAWHHARIPLLFTEMAMWDSDDFLRLNQVRNWMAGAGWFDVSVPRMASSPDGTLVGDMHWSRLVDVPIAGMIWFLDIFLSARLAEILTLIIWPSLLLLATVFTLIAVTERLFPSTNRLLVVIFAVTCITALVEFAPGRIDHHSVQILLFSLTLLGLVTTQKPWGRYLLGASVALSVAIGLDVFLMLVFILAWLGFEWAIGLDPEGKSLSRTAIGMAISALVFFPVSVKPADWLAPVCDAFSIVYLAMLLLISASFLVLARLSKPIRCQTPAKTALVKMFAGAVLAAGCLAILYALYPQCQTGPMSTISPELEKLWLSRVVEAKGLFAYLSGEGMAWVAIPVYVCVIILVGATMMRKYKLPAGFFALWGSLVICFVLGFIQVRAYRIGIFAGIPISVMATQLAYGYFTQRFKGEKLMVMASSGLFALFLSTPLWLSLGNLVFPAGQPVPTTANSDTSAQQGPAWRNEPADLICNRQSQFRSLKALPTGRVLNDLNSGPSILVFTDHSALAGNYHRNGKAILDTLAFFTSHADEAKEIVTRWNIDYIAFCAPFVDPANSDREIMGIRILEGRYPDWMVQVSPDDDRLIVARILP